MSRSRPREPRAPLSGCEVILLSTGLGVLLWGVLSLPMWGVGLTRRQSHPNSIRMRHLRSVTLGILAYRFAHGGFPPQAVHDRDGKPLYSWRVLILPYIDEQQLFEAFHKDEPWDSPHNRELLASRPLSFDSPLEPNLDPTLTHYQVFVGPGAAFEGAKGLGEHDFLDPLDDTILVTEGRVPVPWSSPSDLPFDKALPIPALGVTTDPDKFVAGFADGDVRLLSRTGLGESGLRARITRSGGETLVPPSN